MPDRKGLADFLAMERDPDVPDDELTNVGKIRRALFHGEKLRPRDTSARFGGSNGLLGQVVYQLQQLGFHISRATDDEGLTVYSVTNPAYQPTAADFERVKKSPRSESSRRSAKAASERKAATKALAKVAVEQPPSSTRADNGTGGPQPVALPPLPGLGQSVSIYAQVLNDDGSITVGLKNGTRKWSVTLEGVMDA